MPDTMSDTTKLIIGIALAIVVVALIIWLFASARRREAEARRMEAEAVRAQLAERLHVVQEREDRASVTARIAEEARREAEAAAAEAARLEREAAEHRAEAEAARSEQDELARLADRIDPDVRTDDEGHRLDDSGRRIPASPVASALGMSALAQDDDEPDLADHENPFATSAAGEQDPDWVNSPVDEDAADELEAHAREDAEAADWINGPDEATERAEIEHSTGGVTTTESSAQDLPSALADEEDADWVNSPVDDEAADELEAHAQDDAEAADWINGPDEVTERAESERSTGGAPESSAHDVTPDEGAPFDIEDEQQALPAQRRVSGIDEVVDGGYGVGSAAPIEGGAQPLGHPIMGYHERRTFLVPEAPGYGESEPDVWFYDEDAARRSGFHAAEEE